MRIRIGRQRERGLDEAGGRRRARRSWRLALTVSMVVAALTIGMKSAYATGTLDQYNAPPGSVDWHLSASNPELAQTFTAGLTGLLDTVKLGALTESGTPSDLVVSIEGLTSSGAPNDFDVLAAQTVPASTIPQTAALTDEQTVVFDSLASVVAGTTYALVLSAPGLDSSSGYTWWSTNSDTYAGGEPCLVYQGAWNCSPAGGDFVFATYVSPPPQVGLAPTSVSFGEQPTGSTSASQRVTITNTVGSGSANLAVGQLSRGGADPADFMLQNDHCSNTSLAPGASCTVDVGFTPSQIGVRTAILVVPSNAAGSPDSVALSGNGTTLADVQLSMSGPSSVPKGTQFSYLITVSNAGPSTAHNVVLINPIPSGAGFIGVSVSKGSCTKPSSSGTISCALGDLAANGSAGSAVTVKVTAKAGSSVTDIASAYSTANNAGPATADPNTANNWASLSTTVTK